MNRTVFALKKIKEFNHHFFPEEHLRVINPLPVGIIGAGLKLGYCFFDAAYMTYLWRNWSFSPKSLIFFGAILGF